MQRINEQCHDTDIIKEMKEIAIQQNPKESEYRFNTHSMSLLLLRTALLESLKPSSTQRAMKVENEQH